MNVIGIIGQWIIDYQGIIEIALLSVLALIILIAVISAFARAQKRRSMLEDISNRVGTIQETVTSIQEEQRQQHPQAAPVATFVPTAPPTPVAAEAPDSPAAPSAQDVQASPAAPAATAERAAPDGPAMPDAPAAPDAPAMPDAPASRAIAPGQAASLEPASEPEMVPTKYVTRDWGTDKFGRSYTEEELTQQIR